MAIQPLNTIKSWFKTGLKPSQNQFWETWDSFRHKFEKVPIKDIENLETTLNTKAEKSQFENHTSDQLAHGLLFANKEDKSQKGIAGGYAPLNNFTKLTSQYLDIVNDLVSGGTTSLLSAEQGKILQNQINGIQTLLESDNVDLDTLQEIVDAVEEVKISLSTILVNDLNTGGVTKALTAEMGKKLNEIKLTATIANDAETQITSAVSEDNKIVSRSKLFNWWTWIESTVLHKSGNESFNGIKSSTNIGTSQLNGIDLTNNGTASTQVLNIKNTNKGLGIRVTNSSDGFGIHASNNGIGIGINSVNDSTGSGIVCFNNSTGTGNFIINNLNGKGQQISNITNGIGAIFNSATASTGDLLQFRKNDVLTTKFDQNGIATLPYLIIANKPLTTAPPDGAIERDENGNLFETHSGARSRLITTTDGLIFLAYKSLNSIQTNIDGVISTTIEKASTNTVIGKIGNSSVLRLNMINQLLQSRQGGGTVLPTISKVEIYLKVNNGLFATNYTGSNAVDRVKILEYSGTISGGNKCYQNSLITSLQNSDPLKAQWSKVDLVEEIFLNEIKTETNKSYYLRNAENNRTFGASEAQFSFVFVNTVAYADNNNANGQNASLVLRNTNYGLYLETIRS
ncbi:hypothetical protein ACFFLS_09950 [Flavobacterium procerum]|uniref:Uncharacterized protein n=1 Tax=Flavobacterium procerum TaxID=1455569 RepID=A0ABV6BPH3_9FLAO